FIKNLKGFQVEKNYLVEKLNDSSLNRLNSIYWNPNIKKNTEFIEFQKPQIPIPLKIVIEGFSSIV
ncbi:MAG: hypothetical protein AAFY41_19410, partial [Bacteroidota bacterium]